MRYLSVVSAASLLMLVGGGCTQNIAERAVNKAIENKIEAETGHNADVNVNDGSITFTDNESGATGQFGGNVKLGDDFPSDVPLPNDINISGTATTPDGVWVTYTSNQSASDLSAWYEAELIADGFTKQGSFTTGTSSSWAFVKGDISIGVIITDGSDDAKTTVMVTRSED